MSWDPKSRAVTDVQAAAARIRLWLEQHPQSVSVAAEIGHSEKYQSPEWPFRSYAVDRRDLEALLDVVLGDRQVTRVYTNASLHLVCESCDSNLLMGAQDPILSSLNEAAGRHVCDGIRPPRIEGSW